MRTMSERFLVFWRCHKGRLPVWAYVAIAHDADIRCKMQTRVSLYVND